MKRQEWSSGKQEDPIMSWGNVGDEVKNKITGQEFHLHTKHPDGWALKSGGSLVWASFQDLAKNYTEPYRWQPEHE